MFCQHAYAHSTPEGIKSLPSVLKGSDMAVYTVLLALDMEVSIRPILNEEYYNENYFYEEKLPDEDTRDLVFVGDSMTSLRVTEAGGYDGDTRHEIIDEFGGKWMDIVWLTRPAWENINFVHLTVRLSSLLRSLGFELI